MTSVRDGSITRVLLVEDDEDDYLITRRVLNIALHAAVTIDWVDRYDTALEAITRDEYDVYLIDYRLGERTGLDLLHALRARGDTVPAILLTGVDDHDVDVLATAAGAADFLVKDHLDAALLERSIRYACTHARDVQALSRSEVQKRALIEKSADGITLMTEDGAIQYSGPSVRRILGYAPEELLGTNFVDRVHADDREVVADVRTAILSTPGASATVQYRLQHRDGSWRWIEGTLTNLLDDPAVGAIVGNYRDITERKRGEEALHESETRFRALVEQGKDLTALLSAQRVFTYVGPSITRILGYEAGEIVGRTVDALLHPDDRERTLGVFAGMSAPGASANLEFRILHKNGAWRWIAGNSTNLLHDPAVRAVVANYHDITERKEAIENLRQQHAQLEALYEVSLGLMRRLDPPDLLDAIIQRAGALLGTEHGFVDLVTADGEWLEFVTGRGVFNLANMKAIQRGEGLGGRVWQNAKALLVEGYSTWAEHVAGPHTALIDTVVAVPLMNSTGVTGVLGLAFTEAGHTFDDAAIETLSRFAQLAAIALDNARLYGAAQAEIRERRRAESALIESEHRYRTLIEQIPATVYTAAPDAINSTLYTSPQREAMLGYTPAQWISAPDFWLQAIHPDDRDRVLALVIHANATGEPIRTEYRYITADGRVIWVHDETVLIRDEHNVPLYWQGIVVDITEQRHLRDQLEKSERRFRALIEESSEGISLISPDGLIQYASPATARILGYTPEEFLRCNLVKLIYPEDRDMVLRAFAALPPGDSDSIEHRVRHKDGTYRWVENVGTNLLEDPAVEAFVTNYHDITERKRVEEDLWLHERAVSAAGNGIVITDARVLDNPVIYANQGFERLTGYTASEMLGHNCRFLQGPDTDPETRAQLRHALLEGHACQVVIRNYRKDGSPFWNELSLSPVHNATGTLTHFIGVQEDVSARVQADEALRESEQQARAQYEGNPTPTYTWQRMGDDWVFTDCNAAADRISHGTIRELIGVTAWERFHNRPTILMDLDQCARERVATKREILWTFAGEIEPRDILIRFVPIGPDLITQYSEDITQRKQAEQWRGHLAAIVESSTDAIIGNTLDGIILSWNSGAKRLFGYTAEEMVGQSLIRLVHRDRSDECAHQLTQLARGERITDYETQRVRKDGRIIDVALSISPTENATGEIISGSTIVRDISERKQHEARLIHDATHDTLTGLPNRALFLSRLQSQFDRAGSETDYQFAVLFLDFDRFKYVNDSMGHLLGDQLLKAAVRRLRPCLPQGAMIARLGGDEFAVLVEHATNSASAVRIAERLQKSLMPPISLQRQEIFVTASIGIVLSTPLYHRPEEMLRDADTAMYEAKRRGKARHSVFDAAMHERVKRFMHLEQHLRHGIDRGEFAVWYQPIVALTTGALLGFEALLRWNSAEMGVVAPAEFIPLAEETGLIGVLDRWVLQQACTQMQQWHTRFPAAAHLSVNVNLSGKNLAHPGFGSVILFTLRETGLPGDRLNVEITETALIEHAQLAVPILESMRAQGVRVHLDDFGTGYSSLTYLRTLPIDALKIDRTFVQEAMGEGGHAVLAGVVQIAHNLQLSVTAEGIEDATEAESLQRLGCDRGQGYLYARPLTVEQVETQLQALYAPGTQQGESFAPGLIATSLHA